MPQHQWHETRFCCDGKIGDMRTCVQYFGCRVCGEPYKENGVEEMPHNKPQPPPSGDCPGKKPEVKLPPAEIEKDRTPVARDYPAKKKKNRGGNGYE